MNATRPLAEKLELPLTNATDLVEPSMLGRRLKNHEEYASIRRQRVRSEPCCGQLPTAADCALAH
jgi:hypothetical protein